MQFTLFALLMAFLLMALALAVFGPFGVILGPILIAVVAYVRAGPNRPARLIRALLVLLCGTCLFGILPVAIPAARNEACRMRCANNLQQINLAVLNYQDVSKALPPVRQVDGHGKPLHSWRMLILRYMCSSWLGDSYKFTEPWNGPSNSKLAGALANEGFEFKCPSAPPSSALDTTYLAVVGDDGNWLAADGRFTNPVRVIEACHSACDWMEPRDVSLDAVCKAADSSAPILTSNHLHSGNFFYYDEPSGANAAFADGTVKWIPAGVPTEAFRAALRGDPAVQDKLDGYRTKTRRVNWPNCLALASLIVCVATMFFWPSASPRPSREGP